MTKTRKPRNLKKLIKFFNHKFENFINKTRKQNEFNVNNGIGLFQIYFK